MGVGDNSYINVIFKLRKVFFWKVVFKFHHSEALGCHEHIISTFLEVILFMRLLPVSEVLPGCEVRPPQPTGLFSQYLPKSSAFRQKYGGERTVRHQQTPQAKIIFLQKKVGGELRFKSISLFAQIIVRKKKNFRSNRKRLQRNNVEYTYLKNLQ